MENETSGREEMAETQLLSSICPIQLFFKRKAIQLFIDPAAFFVFLMGIPHKVT